jgi:hypothetical protein
VGGIDVRVIYDLDVKFSLNIVRHTKKWDNMTHAEM